MANKNKEIEKRIEGTENIVISVGFANDLLTYMNSKPRAETNNLCIGLEKAPSLDHFTKMVEDHYNKEEKPPKV